MHAKKYPASLILILILTCVGCSKSTPTVAEPKSVGTVQIEVTLGDQLYTLTMENVADGTTLERVLRNVDDPKFVIRGKDTTAFVESIAGKSTGAAEGWLFSIDEKFANKGIGMTILHPPTTVTWEYGAMGE